MNHEVTFVPRYSGLEGKYVDQPYLSIDFETRGTLDLRRVGVYRYAEHPDTSVICMSYSFGEDDPVKSWVRGDPFPDDVLERVYHGFAFRAFNAQFERVMWRDCLSQQVGLKDAGVPDLEQWYCTAAEAYAMALPRSLGKVARVLNADQRKDKDGNRLMRQMCQPRSVEDDGTIHWWDEEDPKKLERLVEYCEQDVRTEQAVAQKIRRLTPKERKVYLLDQKINDRGVRIDVPLVEATRQVVARGEEEANRELREVTDGEVERVTQIQRTKKWLAEQGREVETLRKDNVRDLLAEEELRPQVEHVLEIRARAGGSSTSKLDAMDRCLCSDGRVRGLLLYHGADTGRWSGKLVQPQNFPRGSVSNPERFIPAVLNRNYEVLAALEEPLLVASSLLRGMFIPSEGHRFLCGDYSQIEARVTGWYAGEPYGDMEYERMAAKIFGVPLEEVTFEQRQVGKVAVLGCGFQMGWKRYKEQVKSWTGITVSDEVAQRAVETYREDKKAVVEFWDDIYAAAMMAVRNPGQVFEVGEGGIVKWVVRGPVLWAVLPSGRPLAYIKPAIRPRRTPWGEMRPTLTYMTVDSYTRKWTRRSAYGGLLTENVVQAAARDIMAEGMLKLEEAGYPIVMSVHDELIADVPEEHGTLEEYLEIMEDSPDWAGNLPVEVEGWEGVRYKK